MKIKHRVALAAGAALVALTSADANHSWNGYHWAGNGSTLSVRVNTAIASKWDSSVSTAIGDWNKSTELSLATQTAAVDPKKCSPIAGQVLVCDAAYGRRGWLGIASIWLESGTKHITQATTKLNDSYHDSAPYNQPAWRSLVACQEIGHDFGLDHQDENFNNANLGTCMDYTNDPTGTKGTNGTLANTAPSTTDFQHLDAIYAVLDTTQLAYTKPKYVTSDSYGIEGTPDEDSGPRAVPEPSSWAMIVGGFGALGMAMRRRKPVTAVAFAS